MKEETTPWIKARERLPERGKRVNGKLKGRPVIVENMNLIEGYISAGGNLERVADVEWLDESVIVRACNAHEDMKQLLTKMHDHIEKGNGMMLHGYDFKPWVTELFELSEQSKKLISKSEGK